MDIHGPTLLSRLRAEAYARLIETDDEGDPYLRGLCRAVAVITNPYNPNQNAVIAELWDMVQNPTETSEIIAPKKQAKPRPLKRRIKKKGTGK